MRHDSVRRDAKLTLLMQQKKKNTFGFLIYPSLIIINCHFSLIKFGSKNLCGKWSNIFVDRQFGQTKIS